jgi:hypothetical protein
MKLRKTQREFLLQLIAEGLDTGEINERAAKFRPRFKVTKQQVDGYRKRRKIVLQEIKEASESDALKSGLALKEERVKALKQLAGTLLDELTRAEDQRLWTENAKSVGLERYDYIEFNKAEIDSFRGLLDDIAAELGERKKAQANINIDLSKLSDAQLERIANGEDPLKVIVNA